MIHQFYFTHCTYATSALERKSGEVAQHPLGYSVRAASVQGTSLREIFRRLERYVYYYLPSDTPAAEKEALTPETAPKRLIFLPETDCGPVLMNLVYRQKDTAGRIGSYFCHALTGIDAKKPGKNASPDGKEAKSAMTSLSALQLWNASGWVLEDSDWFPHDLQPIAALSELLGTFSPAFDERVLTSFLKTEPEGEFYDPKKVIPERWRRMLVSERLHYFKTLLYGFLSTHDEANANLLFVAEPSVAALLFYGICLFFPQPLTRNLSFSTYEPLPDRLFTKIAATTFHDPEKNDLNDEIYHTRAFVLNSWNGRTSNFDPSLLTSSYVSHVWKQFQAGGLPQVQVFCRTFNAVGVTAMADLKAMMEVENVFHQILADGEEAPSAKPLPASFQALPIASSRMAVTLLKRRLAEKLTQTMALPLPEAEKELKRILGTPGHLLLLELLGSGGTIPEVQKAVLFLIHNLPEKFVAKWLQVSSASDELKAQILDLWIQKIHTLPVGCDFLWSLTMNSMGTLLKPKNDSRTENVSGPVPPLPNAGILPAVLQKLSVDLLWECFSSKNLTAFQKEMVIACTFGVSRLVEREGALSESVLAVRQNLDHFIQKVPEALFGSIYRTYGNWFFLNYPGDSLFLGEKFTCLEDEIFQKSEEIAAKLEILFDIQDILPESVAPRIRRWNALRKAILPVTTFQAQPGKKLQARPLEQACESLAQATCDVLDDVRLLALCGGSPATEFARVGKISNAQRNRLAERQLEIISVLCRQWYSVELLPAGNRSHEWMLKKIRYYLQTKTWNPAKASAFGNQIAILMVLGGTGIGLLATLLFFLFFFHGGSESPKGSEEQGVEMSASAGTEETGKNSGNSDRNSSKSKKKKKKSAARTAENRKIKAGSEEPNDEPDDSDDVSGEDSDGESDSSVTEKEYQPEKDLTVPAGSQNALSELEQSEGNTDSEANSGNESNLESGEELTAETPEPQNELPGVRFKPTSPETLAQWDSELGKDGFCRLAKFQMMKLEQSQFQRDSRESASQNVLCSQKTIREAGAFTEKEAQNLSIVGGYVLFEGTAYPFGTTPSAILPPTENQDETQANSTQAPSANGKRKHVLGAEELRTDSVSEEPGRLYLVPDLTKALGVESVTLRMSPNGDGAQCLYFEIQHRAADAKSQTDREDAAEKLKERIRTLNAANEDCKRRKSSRTDETLSAFRTLAERLGKRTSMTILEAKNPDDPEQVEAARRQRERIFTETIPELLVKAEQKLADLKDELAALERQIPQNGGWTPAELERLAQFQSPATAPKITAVFSGSFLFNVPLPAKTQEFLEKNQKSTLRMRDPKAGLNANSGPFQSNPEEAPGETESAEKEPLPDSFAETSTAPSTGLQPFPWTQKEVERITKTQKVILMKGPQTDGSDPDFEMKHDSKPVKATSKSTLTVRVMPAPKPGNPTEQLAVTMRLRQVLAGKATPDEQSVPEITTHEEPFLIAEKAGFVLISFQIQNRDSLNDPKAPLYVTPYYQLALGTDEEADEVLSASGRKITLTLTLEPNFLKKIRKSSESQDERSAKPQTTGRKTGSRPKINSRERLNRP